MILYVHGDVEVYADAADCEVLKDNVVSHKKIDDSKILVYGQKCNLPTDNIRRVLNIFNNGIAGDLVLSHHMHDDWLYLDWYTNR